MLGPHFMDFIVETRYVEVCKFAMFFFYLVSEIFGHCSLLFVIDMPKVLFMGPTSVGLIKSSNSCHGPQETRT